MSRVRERLDASVDLPEPERPVIEMVYTRGRGIVIKQKPVLHYVVGSEVEGI